MNSSLAFVRRNSARIWPGRLVDWDNVTFLVITPRFKASRHVIFLLFVKGDPDPVAVLKTPRVPGDNQSLDQEAANLNMIKAMQAGPPASIPQVLAYEEYQGIRVLVQEAKPGIAMSPRVVRKGWRVCTRTVLDWLTAFQRDTIRQPADLGAQDWFVREIESPLSLIENSLPLSPNERRLLERTKQIAERLRGASLPVVFTHGDLSSPNILLSAQGQISVVDWELATPAGLPAIDMFFFLTYIAFARDGAQNSGDCLESFRSAFPPARPWTAPYIDRYLRSFSVAGEALRPLLAITWIRYLAGLTSRLFCCNEPADQILGWLRQNRYYRIWTYTIEHYEQFEWLETIQPEDDNPGYSREGDSRWHP